MEVLRFQILLPRANGTQVNTAVLDLANFSTTVIDLQSGDSTLLLKVLIGISQYKTVIKIYSVEIIAAGGLEWDRRLPVDFKCFNWLD